MKVVLVGDTQVGKTCLVSWLTTGSFRGAAPATVGAAFQDHVMATDKGTVSMQIWDTAGQEKYRSLAPMYYRNAQAAILVFDLTSAQSYDALEQWATELREKASDDMKLFVVGNKCDLETDRKVTAVDAREFTFRHGAVEYYETSAKTGLGVVALFRAVADSCEPLERAVHKNIPTDTQTARSSGDCKC